MPSAPASPAGRSPSTPVKVVQSVMGCASPSAVSGPSVMVPSAAPMEVPPSASWWASRPLASTVWAMSSPTSAAAGEALRHVGLDGLAARAHEPEVDAHRAARRLLAQQLEHHRPAVERHGQAHVRHALGHRRRGQATRTAPAPAPRPGRSADVGA